MPNDITIDESVALTNTRKVATEGVGGHDYEVVKLASGVVGSEERIGGTAANGLQVDVTRLPSLVLSAGSAAIGHVVLDSGSTTAVTALPALPPGNNVIGHVIADASSAVIGHVIVDTAPTTAVTIATLPALTASSAVIGHVILDSGTVTVNSLPTGGNTIGNVGLVAGSAVIGHVIVDSGSINSGQQALNQSLPMTSGNTVTLSGLTNQNTVLWNTNSGWTGTITLEVQYDGTNWVAINAVNQGGSIFFSTTTSQLVNALSPIIGANAVRMRCSVTGTGTATCTITTSPAAVMTQFAAGTLATVGTVNTVTNVATIGTSVTPGTAATNLGKAGGGTVAATDVGVSALAARNDNAATQQQATNAKYMNLSADQQGRLYVVPASTRLLATSAGLTIVTTAYTSGDQMGTELTVANGARYTGGLAKIIGALCTSDSPASPGGAIDLAIFNAATTPAADNAAISWSDADMQKLAGVISFATWVNMVNNSYSMVTLAAPILINAAATSIFLDYIARSAVPVFGAVGDLKVQLYVEYL